MTANKRTIAIVGNPNCGKTTLFNRLTGSQQKVGNWAGVTVSKKTGVMSHQNQSINIVDLPGIYSLSVANASGSLDERIACQYLLSGEADLIINIVDASQLKRHLFLTLQLLEMGIPCVVALNMMDMAEKQNIKIDCAALSKALGCPVIPLVSTRGEGVNVLKGQLLQSPSTTESTSNWSTYLPHSIQQVINQLITTIQTSHLSLAPQYHRWLAMRLLEKDALAQELVSNTAVSIEATQYQAALEKEWQEDSDLVLTDYRYEQVAALVKQSVRTEQQIPHRLTEQADKILLHPGLGIPLFLLIMYLLFEISMGLGTLLQPLFDDTSKAIFVDGLQYVGNTQGWPSWITAILSHGIGLGINTVLSFIPPIGLLFLLLSFLEDSGYMARAAFVMDRFMQLVGLPGKSFIPLIVGFGCNVPAIMATRTLDSHRDRILTTLMSPFMSCGARLAIFVVFGSTFFPKHAGLLIFSLYLTGIVIAMLTGLLFKSTLLRGQAAPFVLEMPNYHLPTRRNLLMLTWQRLKGFLLRAGKVIVPICVLVGGLNAIETNGHIAPDGSSKSILAVASQTVTPIFAPMGIQTENWPATVGLLTGVLAKEVVVGTLNTLYTQNDTQPTADKEMTFHLGHALKEALYTTRDGFRELFAGQSWNPLNAVMADHDMDNVAIGNMALAFGTTAAAFSYLLFVLLYIPCVSTMAAMTREIGRSWAILSLVWSISIAYSMAVFAYQVATFTQHPVTASVWIMGVIMCQFLWWLCLNQTTFKAEAI